MATAKSILVVEDEPVSLHILVDYLQSAGFSVDQAHDGKEALEILNSSPNKFSVIVLDRIMPRMGGMELFDIIKESSALQHIPVVILTGLGEKEDIIDAVQAGVFDYLTKPVEKDLLIKLIKQAAESSQEIVH